MSNLKIQSTAIGDLTNTLEETHLPKRNTDGVAQQKETTFVNSRWSHFFGIYKEIPEVKIAFDMRAVWTIGKGYFADPETSVILDHLTGYGNDTFNSILKNMVVIKRINGDAFAEIIRDPDDGTLINLKPLDPSSMRIVVNDRGVIIRYEQISKTEQQEIIREYQPLEIFHLTNKRVADEIHGVSDIEALITIIRANKESFADMQLLMHRYVKPMMKFILDTDDEPTIDTFVSKFDQAVAKGENLYIPKGAVEQELIAVPANSTLNPLPWREHLKNYFFQVVGIPQIILGSSGEFTESTAKIAYLAFEQSVDDEQQDIEAQVWNQLGLRIELSFPASLKNELLSDESKDAGNGTSFQPADTTAGVGQ